MVSTFAVILASQIFAEGFKGSLIVFRLYLVNARLKWLLYIMKKTHCLSTLMYGCEIWTLTDNSLHTISVA